MGAVGGSCRQWEDKRIVRVWDKKKGGFGIKIVLNGKEKLKKRLMMWSQRLLWQSFSYMHYFGFIYLFLNKD